ncbi:olfactory receptor 7C2-like [Marmota flaviventris]|uniref:olfactory receptor 7C2-like n=1 Tax=Marmota flaviventris TaxID=93162 RepID=UPI003A8C48C0
MYLVTVVGNLLIILATSSDSHLHTPMYFFLSNLSLADICSTSTLVPKVNIQTESKAISYAGCLTQAYFFMVFLCMDNLLLTMMAYDHYVAICHPLYYTVIMNPCFCVLLVLISFSTCGTHLSVVSLFYGAASWVYLSSAVTNSPRMSAMASVMYTVVTPMLNPFIYSLRNKDMKGALRKLTSGNFSFF